MSEKAPYEPGWVDCGCCAGLQWGGETPTECRDCRGGGLLWRYASGALALYPGGPFAGYDRPPYQHRPWHNDEVANA